MKLRIRDIGIGAILIAIVACDPLYTEPEFGGDLKISGHVTRAGAPFGVVLVTVRSKEVCPAPVSGELPCVNVTFSSDSSGVYAVTYPTPAKIGSTCGTGWVQFAYRVDESIVAGAAQPYSGCGPHVIDYNFTAAPVSALHAGAP
jgi:hypothetical protein